MWFYNETHEKMYESDAGARGRLYAEFVQFYMSERCRWAPENPQRAFKLAFGRTFRESRRGFSDEQVLAAMYAALGYRGADRAGLFRTFDPAKYTGTRRPEDHFVSLFARKLKGKLLSMRRRTTDRGRAGDPVAFPHDPALGLLHGLAYEPPPGGDLPAVLACLAPRERAVVHLMYWEGLSARRVGALLGVDHKTVTAIHRAAVRKLRRLYGVEENLAA